MATTPTAPAQWVSPRDKAILADPAVLAAEHLRLARETKSAVVFIAWLIGIFAAVSIVLGIFVGLQLAHENNSLNNLKGGGSNCVPSITC